MLPLHWVLGYGVALLGGLFATLLSLLFRSVFISGRTLPFIAVVAISAWYGGTGPGLLATAIGALALDYIFMEPFFSFGFASPVAAVSLAEFVLVGSLITFLTARLRAAQQRAETNLAVLDTMLTSAPIGMGFLDRDLRLVRLNQALASFVFVPAAESEDHHPPMVAPDLRNTLEPLAQRVLTTEEPLVNHEVGTVAPEGQRHTWLVSYYPVRVAQRGVIGIGSIAMDVTERTRAEEIRAQLARTEAVRAAVERERARLAAIIQQVPSGLIFVDAETGGLLFNQRASDLFGRSLRAEGGVSQYLGQITRPDGRPLSQEEFPSRHALRGETLTDQDMMIVRPDGRRISVLVSAAPVAGPMGGVQGAVVLFQDVSALREWERLRDEFTAAVAHELRTPVTVIKGMAQLALRRGAHDKQISHTLETIDQQVDRIAQVLDDLLTVIRVRPSLSALRQERVDLGELVRDIVAQMTRRRPSHAFHVDTVDQLVVDADRDLVGEVVGHLLENAWRYSPSGGLVEVVARRQDNTAVVSVTDHGVGVSIERQPHVFEPFYEPVPPGEPGYTGIVSPGLSVAKQIVEAHEGQIWLTSTPGQGSTFSFRLPLARPSPESPAPGEVPEAPTTDR